MDYFYLPLEKWTNEFVNGWFLPTFSNTFDAMSNGLNAFINSVTDVLLFIPAELFTLILAIIAWRFAGKGMAFLP
nr:hypothetical protein [Piscibacillus salipiscarius]